VNNDIGPAGTLPVDGQNSPLHWVGNPTFSKPVGGNQARQGREWHWPGGPAGGTPQGRCHPAGCPWPDEGSARGPLDRYRRAAFWAAKWAAPLAAVAPSRRSRDPPYRLPTGTLHAPCTHPAPSLRRRSFASLCSARRAPATSPAGASTATPTSRSRPRGPTTAPAWQYVTASSTPSRPRSCAGSSRSAPRAGGSPGSPSSSTPRACPRRAPAPRAGRRPEARGSPE